MVGKQDKTNAGIGGKKSVKRKLSESENDDSKSEASVLPHVQNVNAYLTLLPEKDILKRMPTFAQVIAPTKVADFFLTYWEQKYLFISPATSESSSLKPDAKKQRNGAKDVSKANDMEDIKPSESLFSFTLNDLWSVVEEKQASNDPADHLRYGHHLTVCSCLDGKTQKMHHPEDDSPESQLVKLDDLKNKFYKENATIQLFHPQCFIDEVYSVLQPLEDEFDCLWGSNVYITPANGAQGLAPHFDDIEVFVIQTQGSKKWQLYENTDPEEKLAAEPSMPLPQERVGKLLAEYTLKPGDVLYLPRGTIHCAKSVGTEPSVHITISTGQKHSFLEFGSTLVSNLLEAVASKDIRLRQSFPVGYRDPNGKAEVRWMIKRHMIDSLKYLIEEMEKDLEQADKKDENTEPSDLNDAFEDALQDFTLDFAKSRLPPPPDSSARIKYMESLPVKEIVAGHSVRIINPKWVHFHVSDEMPENHHEVEEVDETNDGLRVLVKMYNCLDNTRENHMGLGLGDHSATRACSDGCCDSHEHDDNKIVEASVEDEELDDDLYEETNEDAEENCISVEADEACLDFLDDLINLWPNYLQITDDVLPFVHVLNEANIIEVLPTKK